MPGRKKAAVGSATARNSDGKIVAQKGETQAASRKKASGGTGSGKGHAPGSGHGMGSGPGTGPGDGTGGGVRGGGSGPGPGTGKAERYVQPSLLLALTEGPSYGYELIQKIAAHGFLPEAPPPGMIYRHLRQMEADAMVRSDWETTGGGPAKRVYTITPEGRDSLAAWIAHMDHQAKTLAAFVARYHG